MSDYRDGAVLTKLGVIVSLELVGDRGLFFATNEYGRLDTDRAEFDSTAQRDEALSRTVGLYLGEGWTLAEEQ